MSACVTKFRQTDKPTNRQTDTPTHRQAPLEKRQMKQLLLIIALLSSLTAGAQRERVSRGFKDTRAVNIHSVETLPKGKLDVRISHRFGDLFGDDGGWQTFYGLEQAEDVAIGAEYGFSNTFTAGLYRAKGGGATPFGQTGLRRNINGVLKTRVLHQETSGMPLSMAVVGNVTFSTDSKIEGNDNLIQSFPEFSHRFAFNASAVVARKFGDKFTFELVPGVTHRNLVPFEGENTLFSLGSAARYQITRVLAVMADITVPFSSTITPDNGYSYPLGLGFEWDTGGHVFQLNFTNATGIFETDYIPYTSSSWGDGEFRMGFTISRWFNL